MTWTLAAALLCGVSIVAGAGAEAAEMKPAGGPVATVAATTLTIAKAGTPASLTLAQIERLPLYQSDMATRWTPVSRWVGVAGHSSDVAWIWGVDRIEGNP